MKGSDFGMYLLYIFLAAVILAGIYVLVNYGTNSIYKTILPTTQTNSNTSIQSTMVNVKQDILPPSADDVPGCPNVLIKKGNLLLLIDTHSPPQTGKNPIIFKHLDEYIYYAKMQRESGKNSCPILFLQEESNAQGEDVYRVRPGPFDKSVPPGPSIKLSEISGIQQFFKDQPKQNSEPTVFKDTSSPSSFNKESKTLNTDAKTTGYSPSGEMNIMKQTLAIPMNNPNANLGPGPKNSNDGKLSRVENISTENFQTGVIQTGPVAEFKATMMSSPTAVSSVPVNTVSTSPGFLQPIGTPLSTSSSIAPPTPMYNLPPASAQTLITPPPMQNPVNFLQGSVTGPMTIATVYPSSSMPMTQQPVNTQLFNGTLGRYSGPLPVPMQTPIRQVTPFVDASRDDKPYNQNQYNGFDPYGQFVGTYTNIDQQHDSTKLQGPISDNPMDPNWGGVLYTRNQVASGKYDDNKVEKPIYGGSVNVDAIPSLMPNGGIPIYLQKGNPPANCADQANMKTRYMRSSPENA